MKKYILSFAALLVLAGSAFAQEAPPPHKSPRTPVNRESLGDHRPMIPASREVQGQAIIVDGERLRIGDLDLRLFGVVPPQLAASFGPQARSALDELTAGQNVTCLIRDRDREGRFLSTCRNAANADLALELLRRGLAVTARGSVSSTDFGASYIAAEQAAQSQKVGLWSVAVPSAVAVPDATKPPVVVAANTPPAPAPAAAEQIHPKIIEAPAVAKPDVAPPKAAVSIPVKTPVATQTANDLEAADNDTYAAPEEPGLLARYQLLITGLVLLATALGMLSAISIQRMLERRTEIRAIAAALRGELMAARAVCLGRLKTAVETEDKDISWPRIRSTLYQAYVGRLGWLGAELARRVASIYGQASDYAAYYDGSDDNRAVNMPKRQALQTLAQHIEDILPRLASIERGTRAPTGTGIPKPATSAEPVPERPAAPSANNVATATAGTGAVALASVTRLWTHMQDLAKRSWIEKKPASPEDPIAEYTALIEEEMKRFSFDESEDETTAAATNVTRLHGTGG